MSAQIQNFSLILLSIKVLHQARNSHLSQILHFTIVASNSYTYMFYVLLPDGMLATDKLLTYYKQEKSAYAVTLLLAQKTLFI